MKVTLTGFLTVPPERLEAVRAALPEHIRLTRSEPGCLHFDVAEDDDIPGQFNVNEAFENTAAFRHHQTRSAASSWAGVTAGLTRNFTTRGLDDDA